MNMLKVGQKSSCWALDWKCVNGLVVLGTGQQLRRAWMG